MGDYERVIEYLKKFVGDVSGINDLQIQSIQSLAQRNRIWPIIEYIVQTYENTNTYEKNKAEHLLRIECCIKVFDKLENINVKYAVIKGAYLDKIAYGDIGLRDSGDIDILIDNKDYKTLCRLLEEEGFVCGYWDEEKKEVINYSRGTILYNYLYTHQAAPYIKVITLDGVVHTVEVDINFSISWGEDKSGNVHTKNILKNTRLISYENFKYRILTPEYFLMQICLHAYRDMNSIILIHEGSYVLRLLCDIYYYIVKGQELVTADKFLNIVKRCGYEKNIYYVFNYVTEVFGKNEWIEHVMSQLPEMTYEELNCYGLDESEIKKWPIVFSERIMSDNLFEIIKPQLTVADLQKIASIIDNM